MPARTCSCGARFTTCGAQFGGGARPTCPLCGAALVPGGVELAIPAEEARSTLRRAYREAYLAVASALAFEVRARRLEDEAAWNHALEAVKRFRDPAFSPHAWIFGTRLCLALSENADDALEQRTDGTYAWDVPDPSSAARAVAEHDVLAAFGAVLDL